MVEFWPKCNVLTIALALGVWTKAEATHLQAITDRCFASFRSIEKLIEWQAG